MSIWQPTAQPFIVVCQIPGDEPRIIRGFDTFDEANQELARLNKPTNLCPYTLLECKMSRQIPNETKKLNFGWWFFEYEFVYEPMAAFGVFEDEYRKQFDCDEISTLEMVEIYSDYCNSQKMPSGLIPNIVGAIAYIVFRIRHKAHLLNSSRKMRNLLKQENESDLRIQKY